MHIYTITNQRQTSGNPLKTWYKWTTMWSTRANGKCINNTSVYFNKQCRRCHVTTSFLLGQREAGSSSELPEVVCLSKGTLIQAWKYEYSLDTLWLFIAFLSWPKRFHFSSSCCNQFRGGPLSTARSQALINDRVRAVTQKALTEEQPSAKLPPTWGRGEQQRQWAWLALLPGLMMGQLWTCIWPGLRFPCLPALHTANSLRRCSPFVTQADCLS